MWNALSLGNLTPNLVSHFFKRIILLQTNLEVRFVAISFQVIGES